MGPEEALIKYLLAYTSLTSLVSTRITPDSRAQGSALPAVVVSRIGGAPFYADDGEVGLQEVRFQIDCWGTTKASAKAVARAVKARVSGFTGTTSNVNFRFIHIYDERDFREEGANQKDYLYWTSIDLVTMVRG